MATERFTRVAITLGDSVLCSGITYYALTDDEATVLSGYKLVRDQGAGSLFVQFSPGSDCSKFDCHPNLGGASLLNEQIRSWRRLRD